ncbi:MAG TPA: hypothetical protein PKK13_10905 [Spirochaetota bacterium]|nr:hypothetical protein [Spirochaetota bacterium]
MKIEYNFRTVYSPATSITNILTTGTTATITSDTTVTDKKFLNITDTIIIVNAASLNITFTRCLFVNCTLIVDGQDNALGTLKFVNCTFYNCNMIADTGTAVAGSIIFEWCIIQQTPFLYTDLNITFTVGKPSCIQTFYGADGTITYNDTIFSNPCFIDTTTDYIPDTNPDYDGTSFVLMSKSRGYDYDSPCLGTTDMGCYTEVRDTGTADTDEWIPSAVPKMTKTFQLLNFSAFQDVDGVARSYHDGTKKAILLDFGDNGLSEADITAIFLILNSKDNYIKIYPDEDDAARYIECRLIKEEKTDYSKKSNSYWDTNRNRLERFQGIKLIATIETEVGTWI